MRCSEVNADQWFSSWKRVVYWAIWLLPLVMMLSVPARPAAASQADAPHIELQTEYPVSPAIAGDATAVGEPMAMATDLSSATANTVRAISAASDGHTCALTTAGGVKCWGFNFNGQLGDGTTTNRLTPMDVSGLSSGVKDISGGGDHTCALTTAGGVKCWGFNANGQLGDGTITRRLTPVDVSGLSSGVKAISAGGDHTCALTTAGGVKCWGRNSNGQLGDGTTTNRLTPMDVSGLSSGVKAISAGGRYTCALTTAGGIKCWGFNGTGQLGDGTTIQRLTPVDVSGLSRGVKAISARAGFFGAHNCALTTGGGVKCWGYNANGQLGDGTTTQRLTPVDVSGLRSGVKAIAAGYAHTCAVTTAGGVKCWGYNEYGQLGDGTWNSSSTPADVVGLTGGISAVSSGGVHTCAMTTAGGVKCWGRNYYGRLGDGTQSDRLTPVDVVGLTGSGSVATITSFSPVSGSPGTTITINGTGFTGATKVTFAGKKDAVPTVLSANELTVVVPAGAVTGKVSVTTAAGLGTSKGKFTVTKPPKPTVTGFSQSSVVDGKITVIGIYGTNLTGATKVTFSKNKNADPIIVEETRVVVLVPAGAVTGKVRVTTPGGTATSQDNFTVIFPPVVSKFTPASGAVGAKVTITGKNFVVGGTTVKFGMITAANVTVNSATKITVYVPAGLAPGKVKVTVTNDAGSGVSKGDFTVK